MAQQSNDPAESDSLESGTIEPHSTDTGSRVYTSPLRRAQADRTRTLIIEALTDLLADRPSDEVSTRDIATRACVSERTVYRHFPDRRELHEALTDYWFAEAGPFVEDADDLADLAEMTSIAYATFEAQPRGTTASAVLSSDPRRPASGSVRRSAEWVKVASRSYPDLDERQCLQLAAITRMLGSSQTWLRLREEFGIRGDEAGALASWALRTLVEEARRRTPPPAV